MGKHTPGPWEAEIDSDTTRIGPWSGKLSDPYDGALPIVDKVLFYIDRKDKATLDDIYLIAAAPVLLEACKMALFIMEYEYSLPESQIGSVDLDKLRAAIKKAEGEG